MPSLQKAASTSSEILVEIGHHEVNADVQEYPSQSHQKLIQDVFDLKGFNTTVEGRKRLIPAVSNTNAVFGYNL